MNGVAMRTRFCLDEFELDSPELGRLQDSSPIVGDPEALRERLRVQGYLYMKGFFDREAVLGAREVILKHMAEHEGLEPGSRPLDGVMGRYGKSVGMLGRRAITHHPAVKAVLEAPGLFDFYRGLFEESASTFDFKWLRAIGVEEATGCHMDHVYMGRASQRVMTCWVSFGDIPVEQGTLVVCEGSHRGERFAKLRDTYGRMDVDRDGIEGWFTMHPREVTGAFGGRWLTDDVEAGDFITFGMHLMHASTTNTTDRWRISCDVRFQPSADSMDERWLGEEPPGHSVKQHTSMKQARAAWGV
ncbi:phytanoyl-CoA dioxygenase family protein [Algisphaera agarilytica]|nr:phytanoyl-CoA dioxygenase family protein [Algisphaera agarilytica]